FGQVIKEAQISIIDVYGKVIEKMTVYDTDKYVISSHNKASGVYFVEIHIDEKYKFYKLVVE
ncbi:MAG: T9SS type A sorting domain-containing protein, partial [Bacteroidota bacterium]|nr:T9SS type A sorting domain-containing protein [Bacteroidota bacterium]